MTPLPATKWLPLNPKIKWALIAAVIVGVVIVLNAVERVYPNTALAQIIELVIPVLVGYLHPGDVPQQP